MIPAIPYIQSRFDEFNARYFNGSLPPVPIKLSHAKGFLGKVTFTRRKQGLFRGYRNEDFALRINARIDLPEELVEDTILHEMIHYYIAVNNLKDSSTHGALFRREMARINAEGGRHITVSHRLTEPERAQAVVHKTRMVAVVHFKDGKTGVKVVPNRREHVLYWQRMALRRFAIDKIEWHLTDDDYFAKFPSSVAMKIYLIEDLSVLPVSGTINMG
ncbi:MAG: SprT-like domain-containing protein [Paludibacteraceae bacterium]|nr:SprT-like domain-containing protein [Paludibacteraceae bacterium]